MIITVSLTNSLSYYIWQIKRMKAALVGALRREKMAETTIQNLNIEIDRMKCLVCIILAEQQVGHVSKLQYFQYHELIIVVSHSPQAQQKEEDAQHTSIMLKIIIIITMMIRAFLFCKFVFTPCICLFSVFPFFHLKMLFISTFYMLQLLIDNISRPAPNITHYLNLIQIHLQSGQFYSLNFITGIVYCLFLF